MNLEKIDNIFFIGIGGMGMSSLAEYFINENKYVGGYDRDISENTERLQKLSRRFDQLFTIGGDRRFMNDQDHWIAPNSVRVIWR